MSVQRSLSFDVRIREILLLITNRCNLTCRHCYTESHPRSNWGLPLERLMSLVEEVYDAIGPVRIAVSGGEALVRRDDAFRLLEHAARWHSLKLISNGTLITADVARRLADFDIDVKISLDGGSPEAHDRMRGAGAFDSALRGIDALVAAGTPTSRVQIGTTLVEETIDEVAPLLALCAARDIRMCRIGTLNKIGRARENWPPGPADQTDVDTRTFIAYFEHEFERRHGTNWQLLDVDTIIPSWQTANVYDEGSVYPYTPWAHPNEPEGCLGNLRDATFGELIEGERLRRIIMHRMLVFNRGPARASRSYYAMHRSTALAEMARVLNVPMALLRKHGVTELEMVQEVA